MSANTHIQSLVSLAEAFAAAKRMTLSTVSFHVAQSGSFLPKCKRGEVKNMTYARRDKIIANISAEWPSDLPWPADIPRPTLDAEAAR